MSNILQAILERLVRREDLGARASEDAFREIMEGRATPAQIGAFLVALRMKGETPEEILGAARVMRTMVTKIPVRLKAGEPLVDTCGTGGDGSGTFNISTTVAFVVAGAGVKVAKHGNRSVTSRSGSADCLEALGKDLDLGPEEVAREIEDVGIGFLFAPRLHPAMRYAAGPRRELGIRTIFNVLGPLVNPAGADRQLVGVFSRGLCPVLAKVLGGLGAKRSWVVFGEGGLDEIGLLGRTWVAEWDGNEVRGFEILPEDVGIKRAGLEEISGGDAMENARILRAILSGEEKGPRRDVVLLNAGAALVVAGKARDLKEGVELSRATIDSGKAFGVLNAYLGYHHKS